jgi:hypothetical protein
MITVGVLFRELPGRKNGVFMSMLYMAPSFGVDLFLYTPEDVDFESGTVNGKFFKDGKPYRKVVEIPKLTDNRMALVTTNREFYKKIEQISYCPRTRLGINKFRQNELYLENPDPRFARFVIPSVAVANAAELLMSFVKLKTDEIILKSAGGNQGKNIIKITRRGNVFEVNEDSVVTQVKSTDFADFFAERIPSKGFAQPCINSRAISEGGAPFDIRVKVQRRNGTKYSSSMYPRINTSPGAITSNIHQGGFSIPIEAFLAREYGDKAEPLYMLLDAFGKTFPAYFQKFLKRPFFDLGIDVGIDRRPDGSLQPVIFEVNCLPGSSGYLGERTGVDYILATFEYYHHLWNKFIDESHPKYVGLTAENRVVR